MSFDRRWIFLAMALVVLVFLKLPVRLPIRPSAESRGFFESVESVPPGSVIYLAVDYGPSTEAEIYPMHVGIVYQALRRGLKIVAGSVWDTAPPMTERAFEEAAALLEKEGIHKEYGLDFVNLGYKAGYDVAIAKVGSSIPETYPVDYRGNSVAALPAMQGIENFSQIALLCNFSSGTPGARQWLQQVQTRYRVKMIAGVTAVMAPDLYSFFHSGQISGFLGGLVGAAEYESQLDHPGPAMAGMTVQSLAHLLIILLIGIGNFLYFRQRWRKRSTESIREGA
jgi:hypothetical protein